MLGLAVIRFMNFMADTGHVNCSNGERCDTGLPHVAADKQNLSNGLAAVFAVIGVVSVIMVAIGGFQFIMSQGDPQAAGRARMTIIYSVIGLAVAISAEAIVAFVIGKL
ncbi:MAG TPA: hypothetical protein VLG47_02860 [Candidatus Saccharimonadales bacterium]|nr:hypothetical protein [Candidatus Saccharimonadales bacterium]